MKKIVYTLLLAAMILANASCEAPGEKPPARTTDTPVLVLPLDVQGRLTSAVTLRDGPGSSYAELGQLSQGKNLQIVGMSPDIQWYFITYDDSQGVTIRAWVPVQSVALDTPRSGQTAEATEPVQPIKTLTYTSTALVSINTPTTTSTGTPDLLQIPTETLTATFVTTAVGTPDLLQIPTETFTATFVTTAERNFEPTTEVPATSANANASSPQRIKFAPGSISATVSGQLAPSGSAQYILRAQAGQTMSIQLAFTQGQAILIVWGEDGNVLLSDHAEVSSFQGVLPKTQDYNIIVKGRPEGNTTYHMTITIPPLP